MEHMQKLKHLAKTLVGERAGLLKSVAAVALCLFAVVYIFTMNVAFAVSINGKFIGYAESVDEINGVMDSVAQTASAALGYDYALESDVSCQFTIAKADEDISQAVEETLLEDISSIGEYAILCVDGEPFCAFESTAEASAALAEYVDFFSGEKVQSSRLLESVSIRVDYADTQLLEVAEDFTVNALPVLHVETVSVYEEESVVPYMTHYIYDDELYLGDEIVEQEGKEGTYRIRTQETSVNGAVTDSTEIENIQVAAAVPEIIRMGTKVHISTGSYIWPAEGIITSRFGYRNIGIGSSYHRGIDIAAAYGDDIVAADGGIVIFAEYWSGYGNIIEIEHENGDITYYAHCSELLKEVGDQVEQGELIARMGATGVASGVHLHFEYHPEGGDASNPLTILPERE